ncbi:MAG TPA: hypothetical protein VFR47_29940 [Anaerolineales bacterium]|nr:hypothetical protein [Anaerolineales bacterium]
MTQYRSTRQPPRRAERRSSYRFLVTALLTTTMVATGGFGTLPDNPVTQGLQEEIGQNVPEPLLNPINSYLEQLSAPTIPPQPTSPPNPGLDLVGLLLGDTTLEPVVSEEVPANEISTPTETAADTGTPTTTGTALTGTATVTLTAIRTFTPTSTFTSTATVTPDCSAPSTTSANTTFFNSSLQTVAVYWVDFSCRLVLYATLSPGQSLIQGTYIGHRWWFIDSSTEHLIATYVVSSSNDVVDVSTGVITRATATPTPTSIPTPTATIAQFAGFTVNNVVLTDDLSQFGTSITIDPGQPFYVSHDFQVFNHPSCPSCITQLVTGLGTAGSHGGSCAYHGIPSLFPGVSGTEGVTLFAPSASGTYPVVVEYHWQYTCADALANYGGGGAVPRQVIGQLIVP